MKKLVVVLVALLVILLPRLVDAQEPTNNGTVPYTVWLSVVKGVEPPCSISEPTYWTIPYGVAVPASHRISYSVEGIESDFDRNFLGNIVVSDDITFENIVAQGGDIPSYFPNDILNFILIIDDQSSILMPGKDYYAQLQYNCRKHAGLEFYTSQTPIFMFTAEYILPEED